MAAIAEGLKGVQDRASVEGLAVTTDAEETLLLIGLRTTAARTAQEGFRVLRVRLQGTTGVLDGLLEFPHAPRTTSPGGLGYHLSDVFLQGSGRIFVLATSEDEAGAFHGNRIFCFDVGSGLQLWSTGPFATDQKAEGLTFWEAPPGLERAAIAFDNDFQDTGLAGSILIGLAACPVRWMP